MLTAYERAARKIGLDPAPMIREAGLPYPVPQDPDFRIPWNSLCRLIAGTARRGACEEFGLIIGDACTLSDLGLLGLLLRSQPTLRAALEALRRYVGHQNDAVGFKLEVLDDGVLVTPVLVGLSQATQRPLTDFMVGNLVRNIQALASGLSPELVCFPYPAPRDPAPYRRRFGRVEFGHDHSGVVFSAAQLDRPLASADAETARMIAGLFDARRSLLADSIVDRVRMLIEQQLPTGDCSARRIARLLGVERRTLYRRLAIEGLTFTAMMDQVRRESAAEQVRAGARQLSEVAGLLGFSSLSTFSRWFHRSHGTSAREYRKVA